MMARCTLLASMIAVDVMRCPTTMHRFHFHGVTPAPVVVPIMTGAAPCEHRHTTERAARDCTTVAAGERPPVRLQDVRASRARRAARRS